MNWNAIFTFCDIFGNLDFNVPNQHAKLCFIQRIAHCSTNLYFGRLGMKRGDENENTKDDVTHFGATSEPALSNPEEECEIPSVVINRESSDSSTDRGNAFLANSSSENISLPQHHLDENGNATPSTSTLTEDRTSDNLLAPSKVPLVRSTSLRSVGALSPTPTEKKIVRFADALGLDLEDVRHFPKDRTPTVPQSAFADLHVSPSFETRLLTPLFNIDLDMSKTDHLLVPQFQQPGCDPHFLDKLRQQKVCLENTVINGLRLTGIVRALNIGFEKIVQVRYTLDEWLTSEDTAADYIPHSSDGFSDKFIFNITVPKAFPDEKLIFVVKYVVNDEEYWDNNSEQNFIVKCEVKEL